MAPYEVQQVEETNPETGKIEIVLKPVSDADRRIKLPELDPLYADLKQFCRDYFSKDAVTKRNTAISYGQWGARTVGKPYNYKVGYFLIAFAAFCAALCTQYRIIRYADVLCAFINPV